MENNRAETAEDLRDQHLLEKIGLMLDEKLDKKLNEKFATLDPIFVSIQESFLAIDQRFAAMDERFNAMDEKINALQISMIDVQEKVTILTEDMGKVKETLNVHTNALDALFHRMDKWDTEFPIMSHLVLKIDRWVTEAAPIVGVKYVREQYPRNYSVENTDLPS